MLHLGIKAVPSGIVIAAISEIAKRSPGIGALVASLPLVSVLGMIWLWRDTRDPVRMAEHASATFRYALPSLMMFLIVPALLERGVLRTTITRSAPSRAEVARRLQARSRT